ncbi:hypothetical protein ACFL6C_11105, partial [Myxococcota bacterium]
MQWKTHRGTAVFGGTDLDAEKRLVMLGRFAPPIPVMQPAEPWLRDDLCRWRRLTLDRSNSGCITLEHAVKAIGVVIGDVVENEASQMLLAKRNHVV